MTMKSYDIRFKVPYSIALSGVSGSGKTTWTLNFLKNHSFSDTHARTFNLVTWGSSTRTFQGNQT